MPVEIEAKLKVELLEPIERNLKDAGARLLGETLQTDCYLDDADGRLTKTDQCVRIRRQGSGRRRKSVLTYKGPKQPDNLKKRQEIEIQLADPQAMETVLAALGYRRTLVFEKKRRAYEFAGCHVALDQLPLLGSFVEIEGPTDEAVVAAQHALKLADKRPILDSYATLIDQQLRRMSCETREVLFEGTVAEQTS